jgi:hypothetical protein
MFEPRPLFSVAIALAPDPPTYEAASDMRLSASHPTCLFRFYRNPAFSRKRRRLGHARVELTARRRACVKNRRNLTRIYRTIERMQTRISEVFLYPK